MRTRAAAQLFLVHCRVQEMEVHQTPRYCCPNPGDIKVFNRVAFRGHGSSFLPKHANTQIIDIQNVNEYQKKQIIMREMILSSFICFYYSYIYLYLRKVLRKVSSLPSATRVSWGTARIVAASTCPGRARAVWTSVFMAHFACATETPTDDAAWLCGTVSCASAFYLNYIKSYKIIIN